MDKRLSVLFLLFSIMLLVIPANADAQSATKEMKDREEVFGFLEEAFNAQVSLSEQARPMDEIEAILDPYFTDHYKDSFIQENVVGQENEYQTYGTDFAPYYIPFYAFSDKTKVVDIGKEIYVLEYFPGDEEGPVSYDNHYEALKIVKEKGKWKVAEYLYDDIPEKVIKKAYPEKFKEDKHSASNQVKQQSPQTLVFGPNFTALKTFMEYGVIFGSESKTLLFGFW